MSLPQFIGMVVVFAFVAILLMHIWEDTVVKPRQVIRNQRWPKDGAYWDPVTNQYLVFGSPAKPRPFDWQRDLEPFS